MVHTGNEQLACTTAGPTSRASHYTPGGLLPVCVAKPRSQRTRRTSGRGTVKHSLPPRSNMDVPAGEAKRQAADATGVSEAASALDSHLIDAPKNREARLAQEAKWSGTEVDARQQLAAREAAQAHKQVVLGIMHRFDTMLLLAKLAAGKIQSKTLPHLPSGVMHKIVRFSFVGTRCGIFHKLWNHMCRDVPEAASDDARFRVFLRCRPLLHFECANGEYRVVHGTRRARGVICHRPQVSRFGGVMDVQHSEFVFDRVWDGTLDQSAVAATVVDPLLANTLNGKHSTLLCYGQTGTGKTYTTNEALTRIARALGDTAAACEITFYEIHGKKAYDLLSDRKMVKLLSDRSEKVHVRGARPAKLRAPSADDIKQVFDRALQLRTVKITERNPVSSRSHAVCSIKIFAQTPSESGSAATKTDTKHEAAPESDSGAVSSAATAWNGLAEAGSITVVDLAGSERNYETTKMSAQQHRDSALINKALMALKTCFRSAHARSLGQSHIRHKVFRSFRGHGTGSCARKTHTASMPAKAPYRHSMLTRVLRDCFEEADHQTAIVATVSPTPTDLEHTLNTLKHVSLMGSDAQSRMAMLCETRGVPLNNTGGVPNDGTPVSDWSETDFRNWLATVEGGRFSHVVLPSGVTAAQLLDTSVSRLSELCNGIRVDRRARVDEEGEAWTVGLDGAGDEPEAGAELEEATAGAIAGRILRALRRHHAAALEIRRQSDGSRQYRNHGRR